VGQVQTVQIRVGTDGALAHELLAQSPLAVRLELDINSSKDAQLGADAGTTGRLLAEMRAHAVELAKFGEIAMLS
jgi:hypothetical protein